MIDFSKLNTGQVPEEIIKEVDHILMSQSQDYLRRTWAERVKLFFYMVRLCSEPLDKNTVKVLRKKWNETMINAEDVFEMLLPKAISYMMNYDFRPTILVGEPGSGKTRAAKTFANILGLKSRVLDATTLATAGPGLTGFSSTYSGSNPGAVANAIIETSCANPVLIIDEIDKVFSIAEDGAKLLNELLALTSDETKSAFRDNYLNFAFNAKQVVVIFTANDLKGIPVPLLSRCDVIEFPKMNKEQIIRILCHDTVKKYTKEFDLDGCVKLFDEEIIKSVNELYPQLGNDFRAYQKILEKVFQEALIEGIGGNKKIVINSSNIIKFKPNLRTNRIGF